MPPDTAPNPAHTMNETDLLNIAVGFLLPLVISIVLQPTWNSQLRSAATFAICLAAGLLTAAGRGMLNPADLVHSALVVFSFAIFSYKTVWKPSGAAPAIEAATSPSVASNNGDGETEGQTKP